MFVFQQSFGIVAVVARPSGRRQIASWVCIAGVSTMMAIAGGCKKGESAQWLLNGLLDPTQTGQFQESKRNEIRGSLSILEEPIGIQNAEEPTADDLTVEYKEHRFTPGDVITLSIFELLVPGQSTAQQFTLGNSGFESIPVLGRLRIAGYTSAELELELKEQIRAAGILPDPEVNVTLVETRSRRYSVIGSVQRAGTFEISQPDYRLLSAVADAGGLAPQIEKIYIFRRGAAPGDMGIPTSEPTEGLLSRHTARRGPVSLTMSETSSGPSGSSSRPAAMTPASQQNVDLPSSRSSGVDEIKILDGFDSSTATAASEKAPTNTKAWVDELKILEGAPQPTRQVPVWDAEKGEWSMESAGPATQGAATDVPQEPMHPAEPAKNGLPPETELVGEGDELSPPLRIIEIPTKELLAGDPRYNLVIRPYDLINVPPGPVGEFYMMGNITRSGAYDITGRRMTVKEAIASAGGFGPLAWPSRADLVRRVSHDEEQIIQLDLDAIFAGNAPDFYLKPNDIVNIGTTPAAMFLAVLRNAFRFSYGFGFVYDRNFADSDSFQAKEQTKQRRAQEAQLKGLPIP